MSVKKSTAEVNSASQKQKGRRSLFKKAVIGTPLAITLASRPAYGAVCSLSGFQSVNPSGVARHNVGCGGISPGGWKENGYKTGNQDGSRDNWIKAGFYPNPRKAGSLSYNTKKGIYPDDPDGTLFYAWEAFSGATPSVYVDPSDTLHDVLLKNPGTLEFHMISNFLNANYYNWGNGDGKINAIDIRGVYMAYTSMQQTYTTTTGAVLNLDTLDLQKFFAQLYH
ncbi:hypothetical protein [Thalassotalea euphylliae]|uniref:Uncharacterized protein n=1 Tax=Thalassotalea euphylliae TaxID=1655234 RepID=A0A3E0UJE5_9GAMM|nr:hypothetical protein [Thalassotalea euphylliae]REL37071.1 hypothetical protein DXX92_18090 [Thalassotalea euphylliae]